jgi:predicted O-methyltransferase YrrM
MAELSLSSQLAHTGVEVAARGRVLAALPRLLASRDPRLRALARALAAFSRGRAGAVERDWLRRIERRRTELRSRTAPVNPNFASGKDGMPSWAEALSGTYPIDGLSVMFSIPPSWGRLLMLLVRALRPGSCLELGTGFGLSAAYQAAALKVNGEGHLLTIDAAREWGAVAEEGFEQLGVSGWVEFRGGQIAELLPTVAEEIAPIDFVFIDAEHQAAATLAYIDVLAPALSSGAVLVLDDIGFHGGMRGAWEALERDPRLRGHVHAGRMGIAVAE